MNYYLKVFYFLAILYGVPIEIPRRRNCVRAARKSKKNIDSAIHASSLAPKEGVVEKQVTRKPIEPERKRPHQVHWEVLQVLVAFVPARSGIPQWRVKFAVIHRIQDDGEVLVGQLP